MISHRAIYKCIYRCHRKSGVNFEMINTNWIVIYFVFNFITCLKENVCKHLQSTKWVAFNCCPSSTIHPRIHNKCNFIANYPINWAWRFPPCIRNTPLPDSRFSRFPKRLWISWTIKFGRIERISAARSRTDRQIVRKGKLLCGERASEKCECFLSSCCCFGVKWSKLPPSLLRAPKCIIPYLLRTTIPLRFGAVLMFRRGTSSEARTPTTSHIISIIHHICVFFFLLLRSYIQVVRRSPACRSQREGEKKGMVNVVNNLASALYGAYFCVSSQDVCVCVKKYECFMLCFVYIHINIYMQIESMHWKDMVDWVKTCIMATGIS